MNALLFSLPGHAGRLLRRRDRDGRQHLPGRPQRRAHADAVERPTATPASRRPNPQRLYPAGDHRPRVPLRGGQRRDAAGEPELAAVVDEAADRAAQAVHRPSAAASSSSSSARTARCSPSCARYEDERILVVANLSRFAQYVELDLSALRGHGPRGADRPHEFPAVGELPYLLTLGPHDFYWFSLDPAGVAATRVAGQPRQRRPAGDRRARRLDGRLQRQRPGRARAAAAGVHGGPALVLREGQEAPRRLHRRHGQAATSRAHGRGGQAGGGGRGVRRPPHSSTWMAIPRPTCCR